MEQGMEKLSVIVPAYNEGARIGKNLDIICETVARFAPDYEIIAVNDGSADQTLDEARRYAASNPHVIVVDNQPNGGKGSAIQAGTHIASGAYIAFCDSDLDLHPRQLEGYLSILKSSGADGVIGSKLDPSSNVQYPWHRKVMTFCYYLFLHILFGLKVKDTQTGLKIFRAEAIQPVMEQVTIKRFAFDIEVLALMNACDFQVLSAPVEVVYQRGARGSRIHIRDIWVTTMDTFRIFWRLKIRHAYQIQKKSGIGA